jgi:glutathione reductase (NADPH)
LELFTRGRRADRLGIKGADQLRLDWPAMISRKNEIVSNWSKSKNETPAKLGITALRWHAAFTGAHEIAVAGRNYSADKFVIAIGSKPARPPIWERPGCAMKPTVW